MAVTSWIMGHILSFQPALPVTVSTTLPSWKRMKRGVAEPRCLPSSLARKTVRTARAAVGQLASSVTRSALAG
ncbi:MAG: hypothetical protein HYZ40_00900 [Rhodospirillales bacterium]|nr:hypothetical protein [Rhodospirillales bacterium]